MMRETQSVERMLAICQVEYLSSLFAWFDMHLSGIKAI